MKGKKLPYIHRKGGKWASSDLSSNSKSVNRDLSSNIANRLLRLSRERRLSSLNNGLSPVGYRAKLDFIDTYKNISMLSQNNRLNKIEDSPSVAYLEQINKTYLNPEPFGIVRRAGPETSIDIHMYSMGDVYAKAFSEGINHYKDVKDLNLANNRLTEDGCVKILQKIKEKNLKKISLAENKIGKKSIAILIEILEDNNSKLRTLNIQSSAVDDRTIASLCKAISDNKSLHSLNLAKNNLGYHSAYALKHMLKYNNSLKRLDLHWNSFRSQGAQEIMEGLENNNSLKELDISWNSLGRDTSLEVARALGKALKVNTDLMHLDISYNYFSKDECEVIAEFIAHNHTLLGLHAMGNDCIVDSRGFVIPSEFTGKAQQSHFFSRMLNSTIKKKRQVGNCWVCDEWIEAVFKWIPGVSGEASMAPIYLHLEQDNFNPTLMTKTNDGSYELTRVVPPARVRFFFSNRSGAMKANNIPSANLSNPLKLQDGKTVTAVNTYKFQGIECSIKDPFESKPRTLGDVYKPPATEYEKIPWSISMSLFKDYRLDNHEFYNDCFEFDWKTSKLAGFVKVPEVQEKVKSMLRESYEYFNEAYKTLSAYSGNELFCVTQNVLIDFLNQANMVDNLFQVSDLGVNWNSANAGKEKGEIFNAGNGLCRYEFIEILVRIANDRYTRNKICKNAAESLEKTLSENLLPVLKSYDNRVFRSQVYMTEDTDYFLKTHKVIFDSLFKKYSGKKGTPGQKPFMSLEEFQTLCNDAGIVSESFTTREIDVCYSQAMMTQIDILFKKRHLEMSYVEFLEAICRAAHLTKVDGFDHPSLRDQLVAIVDKLLSACPKSVADGFVKPTEETYFKLMYRSKN
jgi:NLR family CARD domain-containing protein 3